MKTLLMATDLSANSLPVARYAYRLAQVLKAKLLLCYAINVPAEVPQSGTVAWPQEVYDDMERDSQEELSKLKSQLIAEHDPSSYQPKLESVYGAGYVADVVNAEAIRHKADLIIMGAHGKDRLGTWMVGNHSRKMIDAAFCPLLLIPESAEFKQIKRIGFGSDFKHPDLEMAAINQLAIFTKALGAELVLTHIEADDETAENTFVIKDFLVDLLRIHNHQHVSVKVVKSKHVANGLEWLIHHAHIDMLAMAHNQHGFFEQLFHGSYTQQVASQLPIPLLVFNKL